MLKIGQAVKYVDAVANVHDAIITNVWDGMSGSEPGCNLVFVTPDATKRDPYGRQIERQTSLVHMSGQPAHGQYWRHIDEVGKESER